MRKITINLFTLVIGLFLAGQSFAANIVPTAGATESLAVVTGDLFADPTDGVMGGVGGDCSTTANASPLNYPNCGCTTVTTLTGTSVSVTFQTFKVFTQFDVLKIYDGATVGGTLLYDSEIDGDQYVEMLAHSSGGVFTSTSNALTFSFLASTVTNFCGWEALVSTGAGGGGGGGGGGGACVLTCPADITVDVDPTACVGIVSLTAPVPTGNCAGAAAIMSASAENYGAWTATTTSPGSTTPGACGSSLFSILCMNGYPTNPPVAQPAFDDTQLVIDDDGGGSAALGVHCWESPALDLSAGGVSLAFDWQYRDLGTGFPFAEAYDGATWSNVWTGPSANAAGSENVSLAGYNNNDFQVRMCMDDGGSFAWGAAFDNVEVLGIAPVAAATNDFDGGTDIINGEFPIGTTTVTWSSFDASGNVITCSTDITVVDPGPSLVCPDNITVTLDGGECSAFIHYQVDVLSCAPPLAAPPASAIMNLPASPYGSANNGFAGVSFDVSNTAGEDIIITSFQADIDAGTHPVH